MVRGIRERLVRGVRSLRERFGLLAVQRRRHELLEHVRRANVGGNSFLVGRIAEPDGDGQLRRDTAERDVMVLAGSTRLRRHFLAVIELGQRASAFGGVHDALHDLGCRVGYFGGDDLRPRRMAVIHDKVVVLVVNLQDGLRIVLRAAIGDAGIRIRHVEHSDVGLAKRQRRISVERGGDSHLLRGIDDLLGSQRHLQSHETGVGRHGERTRDAAGSVVDIVDVLQRIGAIVSGIGDHRRRRAIHHGLRVDALFQSRDQRERLEGRTARTAAVGSLAGCQVGLLRVPILTADQCTDETRGRIDCHERTADRIAQAFFLRADGILCGLLGVNVKGGDDG